MHGRAPFAWQSELAARVFAGGWPRAIAMPTGSGKTSVLDIAAFHLALEAGRPGRRAPLRVIFVVDRRLVVDDAFEHARLLAGRVASRAGPATAAVCGSLERAFGSAFRAARLRGGVPGDGAWARRPDVPLLAASTVDQAGSRLLFRGYGVSDSMRPVHAGLLGTDVLYVLDEADSSAPFMRTLERAAAMRAREGGAGGQPFVAVFMGATLRHGGGAFPPAGCMGRLLSADAALARRMNARKRARLVVAGRRGAAGEMARRAVGLSRLPGGRGARRVGVVANTVNTARSVFEALRAAAPEGAGVHLLTGRARPLDRDRLVRREIGSIRPGARGGGRAEFFVATQCIEAGVDVDFDALVTQLAPLDSLRQRFGRLDRIGERGRSDAVIVADGRSVRRGSEDPVYGDRLPATWEFLKGRAAGGAVDFGVAHLGAEGVPDGAAEALAAPPRRGVALLPSHVRALARTRPRPHPDPDPSAFLHGRGPGQADVRIVWRADVTEESLREGAAPEDVPGVLACPPSPLEAAPVPVWAARAWLAGSAADAWDVEGAPGGRWRAGGRSRRALVWRGAADEGTRTVAGGGIAPGDTVVVPASYGGCDEYGWDPRSAAPAGDLGMAANLVHRGRLAVRLGRGAVEAAGGAGAWEGVSRAAAGHAGDRDAAGLVAELCAIDGLPAGWAEAMALAQGAGAPEAFLAGEGASLRVAGLAWDGLGGELAGRILGALGMADAAPAGGGAAAAPAAGRARSREVGLDEHCRGVRRTAEGFCRRIGMGAGAAGDVAAAALLHDIGKAEPRFQAYLRGLDPDDLPDGRLLAKGGSPARGRAELAARRRRARLPAGHRHERMSVELAEGRPELAGAHDPDLVLYLVGTHHGHGRPMFPPVGGGGAGTGRAGGAARPPAGRPAGPDPGWAGVLARARGRYGPWTLAHLEAVLRLADHRQSEEEAAPGPAPGGPPPADPGAAPAPAPRGPGAPRAGGAPAAYAGFALPGLRDDSLLSFLALAGAMRLLDEARPGWGALASWRGRHPVLHVAGGGGEGGLLGALAEGLEGLGRKVARLPGGGPRMPAGELARLLEGADPELSPALGCAGAGAGGAPEHTPLCLLNGAGHRRFFDELKAATGAGAGGRAGVERELGASLFARPGAAGARGASFRWDPDEYRPHAHRARDPARERPPARAGANRLAAAGLAAFDCVPAAGGMRTASYMGAGEAAELGGAGGYYDGREHAFWPVWGRPLPLGAVDDLLHYPYVPRIVGGDPGLLADLRAHGVDRIMRAEVFGEAMCRWVRRAAPIV